MSINYKDKQFSRRDFLKLGGLGLASLATPKIIRNITSPSNPGELRNEGNIFIEWQADSQKSTRDYFNLADSPYQKWENVAT